MIPYEHYMKLQLFLLTTLSIFITYFLFLPYSGSISRGLPNAIDPVFYAWNLAHNVEAAQHGFTNLLNTNIFYPETNTLAFSDTLFAQTIVTAPIIILTQNPVLAENLYVLSTFPLSMLTMFFLSYYFTKNSGASVLAGMFYAFSYPRLSQIGHLPAISSQWLPLVFLYLIRYIREEKFKHLCWLFIWYLASITSTMYFGVFLIPLALIVTIVEVIGKSRASILHIFKKFMLIVIPAAIILSITLFPYIRLAAEYPGIKRSAQDSMRFAATLTDYVSVLPTSWLGNIGLPSNTNERPLYPTMTLVFFAAFSFLAWKKHRKTLLAFFFMGTAAFALSLGNTPYFYLYKIYPLLQSVRVPARFSIFAILGLSVLAAHTLSLLFTSKRTAQLFIIITLLFFTEVWQTNTPFVRVPVKKELPAVYEFIREKEDDAIIVELPLRPEWLSNPMEHQLMLSYNELTQNDVYASEAYRTYFSSFHKKRMLNGYSGYFPNIYHDHSIALDTFPTAESIAMLEKKGIRYILIHASQYVNEPFTDIEWKIRNFPSLRLVKQFGSDYVYEIQ